MRKIQFRAKAAMTGGELDNLSIPHDNGWVYGHLVGSWMIGEIIEGNEEYIQPEWWVRIHQNTIGQFTGLCDDKGVDIYEGDIVEMQNDRETDTSHIAQVKIYNGKTQVSAHPELQDNSDRDLVDFIDYGVGYQFHLSCRIRGNVYDKCWKTNESARLISNFYDEVDENIQKDINNIENEELEYLSSIFKKRRDRLQREKVMFCMRLEGSMDNKRVAMLETYLSKHKDTLNRLGSYEYPVGNEYEYYQSKLDWYSLVSDRVYSFMKGLTELD